MHNPNKKKSYPAKIFGTLKFPGRFFISKCMSLKNKNWFSDVAN